MKKFVAVLTIGLMALSTSGASAATKVTLTPQNKVSKKNPVITVKLTGLPATHGLYLSQCMAPKVKGEAPTACNPAQASKLWVSAVEADQKMGALAPTGKITLKDTDDDGIPDVFDNCPIVQNPPKVPGEPDRKSVV